VSSYGDTEQEALESLAEAVELCLEEPVPTVFPQMRQFEISTHAA
jgi:predicted RNase H-like HicB family nuclease